LSDLLATGQLNGTHGIKGYLKVTLFSDSYDHLLSLKQVLLKKDNKEQILFIEDISHNGRHVLIKFVGIHTPEEAAKWTNWEMWINRSDAQVLDEGEYYVADLIDSHLMYNSEHVATVVGYMEGSQALLLEVITTKKQKSFLIPFMKEYIGNVDISKKELELLMIELLQ
jgi:16S rRNA processing protein RimM